MTQRMVSPDGKSSLTSYSWWFGWLWILGYVAGSAWIATIWPLLIPFLLCGFPILTTLNPFWAIHFVVIRRHGAIMNWHLRLCSIDRSKTEYLWLPDGEALLIAQSDEYWWHLFRYDLNEGRPKDRFPFNIVIGSRPAIRRVTFKEDWAWLEPLWRENGVDPESCQPRDTVFVIAAKNYPTRCREFFHHHLPSFRDFPLFEHTYMKYRSKPEHIRHACQKILENIPEGSTAFDRIREDAENRLSEFVDSGA